MKLSYKLLLILVFTCVRTSFGQIEQDTLVAYNHYQKADSLLTIKKYKASIAWFEKALPIYAKATFWGRVASCYNKIADNQWRLKLIDGVLESNTKSLEICNTYLNDAHPEKAFLYDNIGKYYVGKGKYKTTIMYFEKALDIRKKIFPEYHRDIARSYSNLAVAYYYTTNPQKQIFYNERALVIYKKLLGDDHDKVSVVYNNLGIAYSEIQEYDISTRYYKKAMDISIKKYGEYSLNVANTYLNIGLNYDKTNHLDLAFKYYEKAAYIFKREDHYFGQTTTYGNMGIIFGARGEDDKALEYFIKSLNINKKIYGDKHPSIARTYGNMALIYENSNVEKAIFYLDKARKINREISAENNYQTSSLYSNYGICYRIKKDYDSALIYSYKSLKLKRDFLPEHHTKIIQSYLNISDIYRDKKLYGKALQYCQKALTSLDKSSQKDLGTILNCYIDIGEIHYKTNNYDASLKAFNKGIALNKKASNVGIHNPSFTLKDYKLPFELFQIFSGKARVLKQRYKDDKVHNDLNETIILYENMDVLIDYFRQSFQNYRDKVSLAKKAADMYANAIEAHMLKFNIDKDIAHLERAYYYSEKSKSNTLKNLLLDHTAKNFSNLPQEIVALESALKSKRAFYQSCIATEQSQDSVNDITIKTYEGKLFDVSRKQDSLTKAIEQHFPNYYKLKYSSEVLSVKEVQEHLDDNTNLLELFTTDSTTYAFMISKRGFTVKTLDTPDLEAHITSYRASILSKDLPAYKQSGFTLYQKLLEPLKNDLVGDELIIVPDGILWQLNFELLLSKNVEEQSPEALPYVLKDYAISYANSAALLFNNFKQKIHQEKQEGCLAFSFSDSTNLVKTKNMSLAALRDTGDDLPGTRKEIRAIADIIDGQYYFGADADEATFKKHASNYKILHLALHGDVDNERPQNSKLYFTKSKDTIEDSYLYGHELFALNIPSELTVLSACNTGTGKIAKGEGIMSLGNAFQYAGTKSLLLSSWEVPDETAPELMTYFYTNLKNGMNKAKALQQAKLQYLQKADIYKAAPFYWGGFYLVGDTAPIDFGINSLWYWGIAGLILLMCIYIIYRKRTIKTNK
ncbi:hypothetical protein MHTCC0001_04530 [Flavobacteriaceae bacterium MHTCC 0001]